MAKSLMRLDIATNFRADIKAALAGVLTTEHYDLNNDYIATTTLSNKVLRFNFYSANYTPKFYIGDAYVSGTTISNQVTIYDRAETADEGYIVFKGALLALCLKYQAIRSTSVIIGKTQGGTEKYFAQAFTTGGTSDNYQARNTSDDTYFDMGGLRQTSINTLGGKYYMSDLVATSNGLLLGTAIYNLKALYRGNSVADYCKVIGDDVIINAGFSKNMVNYMNHQLLIPDGNL